MRLSLAFLAFLLICETGIPGCPFVCPECKTWTNILLTERHPELGTVTKLCVQGVCDLQPWCFEIYVVQIKWLLFIIPYSLESHLWTYFPVAAKNAEFLTSSGVSASVNDGLATVCVSLGYEIGIPGFGVGEMVEKVSIIKIPVAGLQGSACMGKCPCGLGIPPWVTIDLRPTDDPRRPLIIISASDPDGDIVCAGYNAAKGKLPTPYESGPVLGAYGFFETCEIEAFYEPPCDGVTDVIIGWAKDAKELRGSGCRTITIPANKPPVAEPSELKGEATVVLTPTPSGVKITPKPLVLPALRVWDPEGDKVTIEGYGIPPTYAANLSAFLGSLVALYTPGGLTDEDLCAAAVHNDALVDTFSLTLRDACGATTEVPVKVFLRVEDRIPPKIVYPAQSKTVECDGQGNVEEFQAWLESHGGAWAFDNCPCAVSWAHRIERHEPGCGGTGTRHVTFVARDCAGNPAETKAAFTIVDTKPPEWDQPMPEDVTVECHAVPTSPKITASDVCAGKVPVVYREVRLDGPCPYTYTLVRTWEATDGCHTITHTQRISVQDTTPPELTVPESVDLGCNPADTTPKAAGEATARDNCDPNPRVTYTDQVRTQGCRVEIERTWTAVDACGNRSQGVQRITYTQDVVPPVLTVPEDLTVECHQVPPVGVATATDSCDPAPKVEYLGEERIDGPCPFSYTLIRRWRATDACGNSVEKSQKITVRDTTPPQLTVPGDVDLGCNPSDTGPDVTGWATAQDNCDPNPDVTYTDRVSTAGCQVTLARTWRATDACGNTTEKVQRITYIRDTTPPTIHCPGSIVVHVYGCTAPGGTWVSFPITATDNCDPNPKLSCSSWGGWFPVGTTPVTVECTATDSCGNTVTQECSFTVTVAKENRPPVARSDSADCNGFCCIPVLVNDYDPDGDPLTLVEASARCGNAWVSGNMVCYTTAGWACPAPPGPGVTDTITYTITDGCSFATGTVYITLTCTICPLSLPPGGEP